MDPKWWIIFIIGAYLGYRVKLVSTENIRSGIAAIDGGMMFGSVAFFMHRLISGNFHPPELETTN